MAHVDDRLPLTIRVLRNEVLISTDDGATARVSLSPEIRNVIESAMQRATFSKGQRTASLAASLGEAASLTPDEHGAFEPSATSTEFATGDGIRLCDHLAANPSPLETLLTERRSRREPGRIRVEDLAKVLVRAARGISIGAVCRGVQESYRHNPSAGARHPNELLVVTCNVEGLDRRLWAFDPFRCHLVQTRSTEHELDYAVRKVCEAARIRSVPGAIVFIVSNFSRTLSRYSAGASLVWRDTGALAALLHLCAEEIGLRSCIVGTCGALRPDEVWTDVDTGAVILTRA